MHLSVFLALTSVLWGAFALASQTQEDVTRRLQDSTNIRQAPFAEGDGPVDVKLSVSLIDVVAADPITNQVDLVAWTFYQWSDERLKFSAPMDTVSSVSFPARKFWTPDVVVFGQTAPKEDIFPDIDVRVSSDGTVIYVPAGKFRVSCDLARVETKAGAECLIKFGSWAHTAEEIDLHFSGEPQLDLSSMFEGSKYEVVGNTATREVKRYECCPEAYVSLNYKLTIKVKGSGGFSYFSLF